MHVGMHEAKTKLSELVKRVQQGEQVCITNRGRVVAEIIVPPDGAARKAGRRRKTEQTICRLRQRAKEHPLGTFDELMAWRRVGLA